MEAAITGEAPGLGADQADAVRALCASGPVIRSLIDPAGFGKTTTVRAAVMAANRAGYPVIGLAATNQAARELRQAGVPAAGLGAEIARLGHEGRIPAPQWTENRRQLEPAERDALAHYRAGHVAASQAIRSQHGWEHDLGSPHTTREGVADAVRRHARPRPRSGCRPGGLPRRRRRPPDRIRRRLHSTGHLHGPELVGPAWGGGERRYAAGDRILVHGTLRSGAQRLHNGTVLTVHAVTETGLRAVDDHDRLVDLPRPFVEGHRSDGTPDISHAWARTVDGVQGATWTQVHLLGTAALERFTGYTGQSRSRHATHTWNVSPSEPNTRPSWPTPRPIAARPCAELKTSCAPPTTPTTGPNTGSTQPTNDSTPLGPPLTAAPPPPPPEGHGAR